MRKKPFSLLSPPRKSLGKKLENVGKVLAPFGASSALFRAKNSLGTVLNEFPHELTENRPQ